MSEKPSNERLASLEAKMELLLDLLKEIRADLKNNPNKEDFDVLQGRVKDLEDRQTNIGLKVAGIAGAISVIMSIVADMLVKLLVK